MILSLALFCFFQTATVLAADDQFGQEPIELQVGSQEWEISAILGDGQDRIYYTYSSDSKVVHEGQLSTSLYSDTAPTAVLVDNVPLLAWSAIEKENADSDIYFCYWTGSTWSSPQRVHKDNNYADMAPELSWEDSSLIITWWRNTGEQIMEMRGTYEDGTWQVKEPAVAASSLSEATASSSSGYYEGVTPRYMVPFKCIAFGDSITAGCKRDSSGNTNYWCSHDRSGETTGAYIDTLMSDLDEVVSNSAIYNYGNPGERSYQGASRIGDVLDEQTDANCILIMYGANDRYQGLLPSATRANIKYMADYALARDVIPVIATITPNTAMGGISSYNTQIRELADEEGITLADQYAALVTNWSSNTSGDGLHLSATGDALCGEEWYDAMKTNYKLFPKYSLDHIYPVLLLKSEEEQGSSN